MKSVKLTAFVMAIIPMFAAAQDRMERPQSEFFETILESIDEASAAELQASRDELIASIVGCIGAPASNIAGAIGAPASNIAGILSTLEEREAA